MRNDPERFIESSTDHSWLKYLACMSERCAWADAIVIQAVAAALNLTICIILSNPGLPSVTNISAVSSETDTSAITMGLPNVRASKSCKSCDSCELRCEPCESPF